MKRLSNKGFTLVELLVVISLFSMLSSIVLASLTNARDKARIAAAMIFDDNIFQTTGDRIISSWRFNNTLTDSSGNNLNLYWASPDFANDTYNGSGQSLYISGLSGDFACGTPGCNGVNPEFQIRNVTISGWIKTTAPDSFYTDSNGIVSVYPNYALTLDGAGRVKFVGESQASFLMTSLSVSDGKWHHIAVSAQSGVTNGTVIYVDGREAARGTVNMGYTPLNLRIGTKNGEHNFQGYIDDVRIYNQALNP